MLANKQLVRLMAVIGLLFSLAACDRPVPESQIEAAPTDATAGEKLTAEMVEEAYIWGLPIVIMYRYTASYGTSVDAINQLFHRRNLREPGK